MSEACLRCGAPADGRLRAAIWQEEEKGRLGAHAVVLCAECHAAFLAGTLSRVEIARAWHAANDIAPHGWIGRIDRDLLLNIACLQCGVILSVSPDDAAAGVQPADVRCRDCGTVNRFARRGEHWITAEIVR